MGILTRNTYSELASNNNNNDPDEKKEERLSGRVKSSRLRNCKLMSMLVMASVPNSENPTLITDPGSSCTMKPL